MKIRIFIYTKILTNFEKFRITEEEKQCYLLKERNETNNNGQFSKKFGCLHESWIWHLLLKDRNFPYNHFSTEDEKQNQIFVLFYERNIVCTTIGEFLFLKSLR